MANENNIDPIVLREPTIIPSVDVPVVPSEPFNSIADFSTNSKALDSMIQDAMDKIDDVDGDIDPYNGADGSTPPLLSSGGSSWDELNLGYSQNGTAITIPAGNIWFETKSRIQIVETEITISVDQTWIWVQHDYGSTAATIESGTDEPLDTLSRMKWPLSLWAFADSTATIEELCWVGDIKISAVRGQ